MLGWIIALFLTLSFVEQLEHIKSTLFANVSPVPNASEGHQTLLFEFHAEFREGASTNTDIKWKLWKGMLAITAKRLWGVKMMGCESRHSALLTPSFHKTLQLLKMIPLKSVHPLLWHHNYHFTCAINWKSIYYHIIKSAEWVLLPSMQTQRLWKNNNLTDLDCRNDASKPICHWK